MKPGTRLLWRRLDQPGMDFCLLVGDGAAHTAMGTTVGFRDGREFAVHWGIQWDSDFLPRKVRVDGPDGGVSLDQIEPGVWREGETARENLAGCLDADLACTPFTNTLAIKRLALAHGASADIRVAYLAVPGMTASPARQRYTRLGETQWRYEGIFRSFSGVLDCDTDGLVQRYEATFERVTG